MHKRNILSIHEACLSALSLFHFQALTPVCWALSDRERCAKEHVYQTQLSVTKVTVGLAITVNTNTFTAMKEHI